MIKINLLPYREKTEKENLRRQIVMFAGVLILFFLATLAVHLYFITSIGGLETEIREADARLIVLNKKVGEVEALKRDKKDLEKKLEVIKTLDENRLFPVHMLDEISRLVPARDMWLEKILESENGKGLRIEGMARDSIALAGFMKRLEKVGFVRSVDLGVSREQEVSGVKLQQFVLNCAIKRGM
jgi:type IV pilus assembly protein PilN